MSRVKLLFKSASEIVDVGGEGLLLLTDERQTRQIAVVCNLERLKDIAREMDGGSESRMNLLKALWSMLSDRAPAMEIEVDAIEGQEYHAVLRDADSVDYYPISMTDAVLLVIVSHGSLPLYMDKQLFMSQSSSYNGGLGGVQLPVNIISDQMLLSALDKAVKEENYELASRLRDEIKRRKDRKK